jgi:hypothetical protein
LASETSIPPNLAIQLWMLASLTPWLRHRSATETWTSPTGKYRNVAFESNTKMIFANR